MNRNAWKMTVLLIRIVVGLAWIQAGVPKLYDPDWTPAFVLAFMEKAVAKAHASSRTWIFVDYLAYDFFNSYARAIIIDTDAYTWLTHVIAWGEILIGLSWLTGCLVGLSAGFSLILTLHLAFCDSVRTNILFFMASMIMFHERLWVGYYGLDRYVLPMLRQYKFVLLKNTRAQAN